MNQSQDQTQIVQVLYELAMAIGNSLDLDKMLKASLLTFMKKLDCVVGSVHQYQTVGEMVHFEAVHTIPRHTQRNSTFQEAQSQLPIESDIQKTSAFLASLPLIGQSEEGNYYHLLELPGFGVLTLVKNKSAIDPSLLKSLRPLQEKLATAAIACLSETALRKAQEEAQTILESVTTPLLISRMADGRIIYANQLLAEMIGSPLEQLIGNVTPDFYANTTERQTLLAALREKGTLVNYELHLKRSDGELIWALISIRPFQYQGETALITTLIDITERKQTVQALEESQARTQLILESVTLPLLISRVSDGAVLFANERISDLIGISLEDVMGKQTPNFYQNSDDRLRILNGIREHGGNDNKELAIVRFDGQPLWVLLSNRLIQYDGEPAIITTLIDITDRKIAEEALAQRAAELETVARVSASAANILEPDKLLQEVVNLTKERFDLYHAHVYLFNQSEDTLILAAGAGEIGQKMVAEKRSIPLNQEKSLVAQAARNRKGVIENDVLGNPAFLPHPLLPDTRAEMAVPMLIGNKVVGVLDVQADQIDRFTQQDIVIKTILSAQIAIALENARSFENAQTSLAETEALLDITRESSRTLDLQTILESVLDRVLATTKFDIGLISVANPETQSLELVSHRLPDVLVQAIERNGLDGTLCDLVYRRKDMIVVVDLAVDAPIDSSGLVDMGYASYQGVPIEAKGNVLGTICLFSTNRLASDEANTVFLQAVGQHVGIAVQNARLFEQTNTALAELKDSQKVIQERESLLHTIIDSTPDWIFVTNKEHRYQLVNKAYAESLQISPENAIGKTALDLGVPKDIVKGNLEKGIQGFWPDDDEVMAAGEMKITDIEPAVIGGEHAYIRTIKSPLNDANGNVIGLVGFVHDITGRIQAEEKLAKQADELTELTRRLTREGWQEYLNSTASEDMAYVYDRSQSHSTKSVAALTQPELWAEVDHEVLAAKPLIQSISIHGEPIGRLAILPEDNEDEIDLETAEIVRSVVEQLEARIENLRLADQTEVALAETEEQAQRLGRLNEMSAALNRAKSLADVYTIAVAEASKVLAVDWAGLTLLNDSLDSFEIVAIWGEDFNRPLDVVLTIAEPSMRLAVQENRIVRGAIEGVMNSALFVPLVVGNKVIGTLNAGYKETKKYKASDENLLRQAAALVSSNIENMRFLANEQARAQREQMLRQISQRIRSSADVETIMRTAVQEIGRTLGRKTYIYLGDDHES